MPPVYRSLAQESINYNSSHNEFLTNGRNSPWLSSAAGSVNSATSGGDAGGGGGSSSGRVSPVISEQLKAMLMALPLEAPRVVPCAFCHRRFKNQSALNGHMRLHGGYGLNHATPGTSTSASSASGSGTKTSKSLQGTSTPPRLSLPGSSTMSRLKKHQSQGQHSSLGIGNQSYSPIQWWFRSGQIGGGRMHISHQRDSQHAKGLHLQICGLKCYMTVLGIDLSMHFVVQVEFSSMATCNCSELSLLSILFSINEPFRLLRDLPDTKSEGSSSSLFDWPCGPVSTSPVITTAAPCGSSSAASITTSRSMRPWPAHSGQQSQQQTSSVS
ncbi:hypothetical protein ACTXT7_013088 [Hymenolepis weldensis]